MKYFNFNRIKLSFFAATMAIVGASSFGAAAHADTMSTTSPSSMVSMTANASSSTVSIMVMKHLCNSNIKNLQDFENLEAGKSPVAALANTVLNCPTTGLPGNEAVAATVASPRMQYNFEIKGNNGTDQTLTNANFMQHKLCESDINVDVTGDGTISPTTCLDISHYEFPNVQTQNGMVDVTETTPPAGFHFGALRFTPSTLAANNDKDSLVSIDHANGIIHLNTSGDTDKMIMLHVYNFQNSSTTPGTGTNTPTTTLPSFNNIGTLGWLVLPQTIFNSIYNTTASTSSSPSVYTMVNGYPTINNNYVDCNGNVDNDMGHHSTNPGDADPGHHIGQNCPGGMPKAPGNTTMNNNSSQGMTNNFFTLSGMNNSQSQFVLVPLNGQTLQKLFSYLFMQ